MFRGFRFGLAEGASGSRAGSIQRVKPSYQTFRRPHTRSLQAFGHYKCSNTNSRSVSSTGKPGPDQSLAQQRLHRPVSPHLGIYRLNINYFLSPSNRIAAIILTTPLYLFGGAYLVAPVLGWHFTSASIAAAFGALPVLVKVGVKFCFALPMTLHCLDGVRHLLWDTANGLTNRQTYWSGWVVAGLSLLGAAALTLM